MRYLQNRYLFIAALIVGSAAFVSGCESETTGLTLGDASSCGDNAVMCAQGCANIKVDAQNCGSCGHACETDEACVDGSCAPASSVCSSSSQKYCMGSCVDVKSNPIYCGDCNTKCKDNESCKDGNCVVGCAANYTLCDGVCYNLLRDAEHCGDCDNACGSNMFCIGGGCKCQNGYFDCNNNPADGCESEQACGHTLTCESEDLKCGDKCCLSGETCCGGDTCVDTQTDALHCGACDVKACLGDEICVDGSCTQTTVSCEGNEQQCHDACVDVLSDVKNCGECDIKCGNDQKCDSGRCVPKNPIDVCNAPSKMCYGVCTDITSDDKNCGECLNECGESEKCVNSRCELQCGELTNCGGACYNTKTSANHCGDCATACKDGQACNGGTCGCAAGRWDCDGNTANGCESTTQCTCTPRTKQACWRGDEANRKKGICTDGEQICDDSGQFWGPCTGGVYPSLITCDDNGRYIGGDQNCNGINDATEECVTKCDTMLSDSSYIGCEYWAAYNHNYATGGYYSVILSNMNEQDAKVTIYYGSDDNPIENITIPKGTVKTVHLSEDNSNHRMLVLDDDNSTASTVVQRKGFRIISTLPITAYQFNTLRKSAVYNDALLLLPKNVYGNKYYNVIGSTTGTTIQKGYSYIAIQATSPGSTKFTITPAANTLSGRNDTNSTTIGAHTANTPFTYTLQQYDVFQVTANADMTGTKVTADKPFVAIAGCPSCYNAVKMSNDVYDHYSEQLFPYQSWGSEYATGGFKKQESERDQYRIVAVEDTQLTITPSISTYNHNTIGGSSPITLRAGEVYDIVTAASFHMKANKPILVAGFLGDEGTDKDPSYMLVVPVQQFRSDYSFMIPAKFSENIITITAPKDLTSVVVTNINTGTKQTITASKFTGIPSTNYMYYHLDMGSTAGTTVDQPYTIVADKPIGLQSYGYTASSSYAYPLGLNLIKLNLSN